MILQSIKKQYMEEQKSITKIKRLFPHLSAMSQEDLLHYFNCMTSTELIDISSSLSKADSFVYEEDSHVAICRCKDGNGIPKTLYEEHSEAERVKNYVYGERKVRLRIYACSAGDGWHLSKV